MKNNWKFNEDKNLHSFLSMKRFLYNKGIYKNGRISAFNNSAFIKGKRADGKYAIRLLHPSLEYMCYLPEIPLALSGNYHSLEWSDGLRINQIWHLRHSMTTFSAQKTVVDNIDGTYKVCLIGDTHVILENNRNPSEKIKRDRHLWHPMHSSSFWKKLLIDA